MKRVAVTGLGIANSLGVGVADVWRRLVAGDNGVRKISFFDAAEYRMSVAAEIPFFPLFDPDGYDVTPPVASVKVGELRRGVHIFHLCASEAVNDSGIAAANVPTDRIGVAAGGSIAYLDHTGAIDYYRHRSTDSQDVDLGKFSAGCEQRKDSFLRRSGDMMATAPAKTFGFRGPVYVIDTACAASGHAIGSAFRRVRDGSVTAMVAGGAATLVSPVSMLYFAVLGALSRNDDPMTASRPFDRDRDGFVMGEGGGAVVLEEMEHARARGATIYAELAGYGSTTTALNLVDPSPDGSYEGRAMQLALEDAGLKPESIAYVVAHGTSTPKNDVTETLAIRQAFGSHSQKLMVSSNKAQVGHTISGAAVTNLIVAVKSINDGIVPGTMHLQNPEPTLDLDFVPNQARKAAVEAALVNSFAFGGHNAVLAVKAAGYQVQ